MKDKKLAKTIKHLESEYQAKMGMPKGMRLDEWFEQQGMTSMAEAFRKDYKRLDTHAQ